MKYLLVLFIMLTTKNANASTLDQKTIFNASKATLRFETLTIISKKCDYTYFLDIVSEKDLEKEINSKLKISHKKFKEILLLDHPEYSNEIAKINTFSCDNFDKESLLEKIYDEYDMDLFNLNISMPLDKALLSSIEIQELNNNHFNQNFSKLFAASHSIAIGTLILTKDIPIKYKQRFVSSTNMNKYSYFLEKGWKASTRRYVVGEYWTHESDIFKENTEKNLGVKTLFFIESTDKIIQAVPMADSASILDKLGKHEWYWSGHNVYRN